MPSLVRVAIILFMLTILCASAQAAPTWILALGDSLTAGYGLAAEDAFPAVLERRLRADGYGVRVENCGRSGDTTAGGRARLTLLLQPRHGLAIVALGANDALRRVDPAVTQANLAAMLTLLAQRRVPVLLAGMRVPPSWDASYARRFNLIYPRLAARFQVLLHPSFMEPLAQRPGLTLADGLHPNRAGVKAMVEAIYPKVLELLAKAGIGPSRP